MSIKILPVLLLFLLALGGCMNSMVDDPSAPSGDAMPLGVAPLGPSTVRLQWTASGTSDATYYLRWEGVGDMRDTGLVITSQTSATVSSLLLGRAYLFTMTPYLNGAFVESQTRSIVWSPSDRYTLDRSGSGTIRLFETGSDSGSGLVLDPVLGGPARVPIAANLSAPASVQLALWTVAASSPAFNIGPAHAFPSYRSAGGAGIDSTVAISSTTYLATSLGTWFASTPINRLIDPNGTVKVFSLPAIQSDGQGQGFYVRTGTPSGYHYARVLIINVNGQLLQGSSPNRFVELEISYQATPDLPFAKAAGSGQAPVQAPATAR